MTMGVFGTRSALLFLLRFWVVFTIYHDISTLAPGVVGIGNWAGMQLHSYTTTDRLALLPLLYIEQSMHGIIFSFLGILQTNPNYGPIHDGALLTIIA